MSEYNMIDGHNDPFVTGEMIEQRPPHGVYVKIDQAGRIVGINSDAFLPNLSSWERIDEGYGDKYHHAQGNYFDKPIIDERGIYRYKLVDGKPVERTQEEMGADYIPPTPAPMAEERMVEIEKALIELAALMGG